MQSALITLLTGLMLSACVRTDTKVTLAEDPDWVRLEAPTGGEALDVAGNIDSTLFVATMFQIYKTTDRGQNWDLVWSKNIGPNAVLIRNDTLWRMRSIINMGTIGSAAIRAADPSEYSLDAGKTWQPLKKYLEFDRRIDRVEAANGTAYTIKQNVTGNYVNPSDIVKQTGGSTGTIRFPFKHTINSLMLDSQNRLYVAVSGTYLPEKNGIYCCPRELPSVVYVSKRPLP